MTPNQHDTQAQLNCQAVQNLLHNVLRERMLAAIRTVFVDLLDEEVAAFLGAGPYQRTPQRQSRRSGYYTRDLTTSVGTVKDLPVPRTRNGFKTRLFESYQRRMAELDQMSAPFRNEESCLLLFYAVTRSLKFQNVVMLSAPG